MDKAPETIYLIPGEWDGEAGMVWCDDPAPSYTDDPAEAVEYVRKECHVPTGRVVLRTKEHPSGRTYEAAEFFAYDQWWSTDIVCERDLMMVRRMADNHGMMFMDERRKTDAEA